VKLKVERWVEQRTRHEYVGTMEGPLPKGYLEHHGIGGFLRGSKVVLLCCESMQVNWGQCIYFTSNDDEVFLTVLGRRIDFCPFCGEKIEFDIVDVLNADEAIDGQAG
jgi:hypothetical protein